MIKYLPLAWLILMLASCSTSQDVVQDGFFQKRKYFKKGWFVDKPITRGLEELQQDEVLADQNTLAGDPYLKMIPVTLAELDNEHDGRLPDIELAMVSMPASAEQPAPHAEVLAVPIQDEVPVKKGSLPADPVIEPVPTRGVNVPIVAANVAMLLPVVLLVVFLLLLQRLIRVNENNSATSVLALLMGMLSLAALAFY